MSRDVAIPKRARKAKSAPTETVRGRAYAILSVDPLEVAVMPRIEHLFRGIGGKQKVFEYLSGSAAPEARRVLDVRAKLSPSQARVVPFEAYCLAAGVTTKRLIGLLQEEVFEQSRIATSLLVRSRQPELVDYTIGQAMTPHGSKERQMVHENSGFIKPSGVKIVNPKGDYNEDNSVGKQVVQQVAILPTLEDSVRRMADRFNDMGPRSGALLVEPLRIEQSSDGAESDEGDEQ
jgi:hypothetical protein